MRKRNVDHIADTVFWYLLYSLPFLAYLFMFFTANSVPFTQFFTDNLGFVFSSSNPVFSALSQLFGSDGVLPLFANDSFIIIATWFISVFVVHLAVDIILFIPRFCHKFLSKSTQGD